MSKTKTIQKYFKISANIRAYESKRELTVSFQEDIKYTCAGLFVLHGSYVIYHKKISITVTILHVNNSHLNTQSFEN